MKLVSGFQNAQLEVSNFLKTVNTTYLLASKDNYSPFVK